MLTLDNSQLPTFISSLRYLLTFLQVLGKETRVRHKPYPQDVCSLHISRGDRNQFSTEVLRDSGHNCLYVLPCYSSLFPNP